MKDGPFKRAYLKIGGATDWAPFEKVWELLKRTLYLRDRASKSFVVVLLSFLVPRKRIRTHLPSSQSFEIVCSCVFIVCSSSKTNEDPFTSELELRNCLQLFVVYFFSFVVRQKLTLSHFTPRSSFEIVCSCAVIVCSYSKTNKDPFSFELEFRNRLQLCFYRLQFLENERGPIYFRDRALKSFVVVYSLFFFVCGSPMVRGTTIDKSTTTNDSEPRARR